MKDFIFDLLGRKGVLEQFEKETCAEFIIKPPAPKSLLIRKCGNAVTIREAHVSFFRWSKSSDDVEMKFRITEDGHWIPMSLREGLEKPRPAFTEEDGAISPKPIVMKRQSAFAKKWTAALTIRNMLQGYIEDFLIPNED